MPVIKDGRLVEDDWTFIPDFLPLDEVARPVVSLARWRDGDCALRARNGRLGLRLPNDTDPAAIGADLDRFALIELEFPVFKDGRAYSQARLLRERHGYRGELRAVGEVVRDQYFFLERCGFDSVSVAGDKADQGRALEGWYEAMAEISVPMQPAADQRPPASSLRERRRAAAVAS
ncbi:MAG: DUF934 domain-containing protein [Rhodospirillaceae bacterium]|jgi:uncharacterized protein (DUF934 family)|nr:DUF934 domain-containing protein [Rhodospirillaceae bacterium]MBT6118829.1 DUF934 domain-containing protein [Rhodospirillaceae bacterium]